MKNHKETLDAVALMRETRDKMSADMKDMTFEERKEYIENRASRVREELLRSKQAAAAV